MPAFVDITGQRFGRLTAIKAVSRRNHQWCWRCQCDCGQLTVVAGGNLRNGHTTSCGCWQRKVTSLRRTTHGASKPGKRTVEYETWQRMMDRCYNPNNPRFKNYGGRGIRVCKRWHTFVNFLADMGLRPAGRYSIERLDVNGNYEPGNCIWLPMDKQVENKRPRLKREPWKEEGTSRMTWYRRHGSVRSN